MRDSKQQSYGDERLHPGLNYQGSQLRIIQFSDSIMAFTRDASSDSSLLIEFVSQMFFLGALQHGTALRGAIACGTVTADFEQLIFFGQPIIDAYLLEQDQAWYGIIEHPSVFRSVEIAGIQPLQEGEIPLAARYGVPLKSSGCTEMSVINWPVLCEDIDKLDQLLLHLRNEHSTKLHSYYSQTQAFGIEMFKQFRS